MTRTVWENGRSRVKANLWRERRSAGLGCRHERDPIDRQGRRRDAGISGPANLRMTRHSTGMAVHQGLSGALAIVPLASGKAGALRVAAAQAAATP
jgi:hypothetical protein